LKKDLIRVIINIINSKMSEQEIKTFLAENQGKNILFTTDFEDGESSGTAGWGHRGPTVEYDKPEGRIGVMTWHYNVTNVKLNNERP
jgi:hypothetical protein